MDKCLKKRYENIVVKYSNLRLGGRLRVGETASRGGGEACRQVSCSGPQSTQPNQPNNQIHQKITILYHYCRKLQPDHICNIRCTTRELSQLDEADQVQGVDLRARPRDPRYVFYILHLFLNYRYRDY